jgi:hypothetical protein
LETYTFGTFQWRDRPVTRLTSVEVRVYCPSDPILYVVAQEEEKSVINPTDCYTTQAEAPAKFTQCGYFPCQYHNAWQINCRK